jgi:quinol monooxygenase YgiN
MEVLQMGDPVSWVIELAVKPGQLETFRALMNEMVESTRPEPGTLSYEWFVSEDGSVVHIYERYSSSETLVTHFKGFLENFAERFMAAVDPTRFFVYGAPNAEAREFLAESNPTYLGPFGGFVR